MKRIFTYIAMLTLAVGCSELYGPEETPLTPDKAGSVEIKFSDVTDDSFKVTVTASGNVSYYSYLVDAADEAYELDPQTLYEVGYESVAQGTVQYAADAPSYTFEVAADPNTTYQVYAVAASAMGFPGTVVTNSVKTPDTVAPEYADIESDENIVLVTFSENVAVNPDAEAAITVPYYAYYTNAFQNNATSAGEVTVPAEAIEVSGNQAQITVPGLPTGCYYTIDIPEGIFVDEVGQPIPAYSSTFVATAQGVAPNGFYGEVSYVELPMFGEVELETIDTWDSGILVPLVNEYSLAGYSSTRFVTVTYESETANSTSSTVYTLEPGVDYGVISLGFVVMLPEKPVNGANITINIPAGCVYDIYGNDSEATVITTKYLSGYTLDDIIGSYVANETSAFDGETYAQAMSIVESDDPTKGNVMFTSYWDMTCQAPIYADFDTETGTLTIPSQQLFTAVRLQNGSTAYCMFATGEPQGSSLVLSDEPVEWQLDGPNMITGPSNYYGVYAVDPDSGEGLGWFDAYYSIEASLSKSSAAASASASVMKKVRPATEKVNFIL